jgi:hypothetical protein
MRRGLPLNLALGARRSSGSWPRPPLVSFVWLPHDPHRLNFAAQLSGPTAAHWFGTDHFGRDLFSRVLVGARATLYVGFIAVGIALSLGSLVGALAGWWGGWLDEVVMRLVDVLYAFPAILMALLLAAVYRPGHPHRHGRRSASRPCPIFARLMRASVVSLRERDFVEAGRALGAERTRACCGATCSPARSPPSWCRPRCRWRWPCWPRRPCRSSASAPRPTSPELGQHAARGAGVHGDLALRRAGARPGHPGHRAGLEPARGRAARSLDPTTRGN